jgi:hypothetical protein
MDDHAASFPQHLPSGLARRPQDPDAALCQLRGAAVLVARCGFSEVMLRLAAGLAAASMAAGGAAPLHIIDGGNCLQPYALARALYRFGCRDVEAALAAVKVQRGFMFYQVGTLLRQAPAGQGPVLVLDLLSAFLDEAASVRERRQSLQGCLADLRRLAASGLVVASVRGDLSRHPEPLAHEFLEQVLAAADGVWEEDLPASPPARTLDLGI